MNNKTLVFFLILFISPLIAGVYGIIHNQLTYSISSEFFTKFMFYRFGLDEYFNESQRLGVSIVGFLSSWWVGLPIGIILGLVGWIFENGKVMFKNTLKAIALTIFITLLTPFISVTYEFLPDWLDSVSYEQYYFETPSDVPENVVIQEKFLFYLVGLIHNYSYLGGLIGLIIGIAYLIWSFKKVKPTTNTSYTTAG